MLSEYANKLFSFPSEQWEEYETYYLSRAPQTSDLWKEHRKYRATASHAGEIIYHSCHDITKLEEIFNLREKQFSPEALERINHGCQTEKYARQWYEKYYQRKVTQIGLFVYKDEPFLGCSVDGLVGNDGIIEIKCPFHLYDKLYLRYEEKQMLKDNSDNNSSISNNISDISSYHYAQMQVCLYLTKRKWCDYIVFATESQKVYTERINYDEIFINETFLPCWEKLQKEIFLPYLQKYY